MFLEDSDLGFRQNEYIGIFCLNVFRWSLQHDLSENKHIYVKRMYFFLACSKSAHIPWRYSDWVCCLWGEVDNFWDSFIGRLTVGCYSGHFLIQLDFLWDNFCFSLACFSLRRHQSRGWGGGAWTNNRPYCGACSSLILNIFVCTVLASVRLLCSNFEVSLPGSAIQTMEFQCQNTYPQLAKIGHLVGFQVYKARYVHTAYDKRVSFLWDIVEIHGSLVCDPIAVFTCLNSCRRDHDSGIDSAAFIILDGMTIPGRFLFGEGEASRSGVRTGASTERPLVFADVREGGAF